MKRGIRRFDVDIATECCCSCGVEEFERDNGKYVLFKDHKARVNSAKAVTDNEVRKRNKFIQTISKNYSRCPDYVIGNCCSLPNNEHTKTTAPCESGNCLLESESDKVYECWQIYFKSQKV